MDGEVVAVGVMIVIPVGVLVAVGVVDVLAASVAV